MSTRRYGEAVKLYFFRARCSTVDGVIQYRKCPIRTYHHGRKTSFSPSSIALISRCATSSRFRPCLLGEASRTGPASTADVRKSPSTVAGRMCVNLIFGCSIASDWYRVSDAALLAQYSERVGAGIIAAALDTSATDGLREDDSSSGICQSRVRTTHGLR